MLNILPDLSFPLASFTYTLHNGLQCCFIPRKDQHDYYASLTVKFGAYHTYLPDHKSIPSGTAHFLEHIIFSADALQSYQALGTFANASTNYDKTTYRIQFSSELERNIQLLFDIVLQLRLTNEQIDNERSIINHELKNTSDRAEWKALYHLLEALYDNNPIRNPIGGTSRSLEDINESILQDCFQYYYQPANMILFVTGDFQVEEVKRYVENYQWHRHCFTKRHIEAPLYEEPANSRVKFFEDTSVIASPYYLRGWKYNDMNLQGQQLMERSLMISILLEVIFGKTSQLYNKLIAATVISDDFEWQFECFTGLGTAIIGGYTMDARLLDQYIVEYIETVKQSGFAEEDITRVKKYFIGMYVRHMEDAHQLATIFTDWQVRGASVLHAFNLLNSLNVNDINDLLSQLFIAENSAVALLTPIS